MTSQKIPVIEYLFLKYWNESDKKLRKTLMSMEDVKEGIIHCNEKYGTNLKTNNPANFLKDIIRKKSASKNWPISVTERRYTAIQRTGSGDVFEFIPFKPDQTEAFPDKFAPTSTTPIIPIQSISIPLVSKTLGRKDEPWLIQTAVNLKIVESHFAITSKHEITELSHLQMSVKIKNTEIDALFLGTIQIKKKKDTAIITCEAKQYDERILEDQIISQVKSAFSSIKPNIVIPIALSAI